ncbi:MAG: hypothetical protein WCL14_06850 [Bacteroidota bacterium]
MSFSKRKYRSGYYMDFASRHKAQHYPSSKTFKEHSQDFMGHYASIEPVKPHETLAPDPSKQQGMLLEHPYITANHQPNKFYLTAFINIESIKLHSILNDNPTTELPEKKGQEFLYAAFVASIVFIFLVRQSIVTFTTSSPFVIIGLPLLIALLLMGYFHVNKKYYEVKRQKEKQEEEIMNKNSTIDYGYLRNYAMVSFVLSCIFLAFILFLVAAQLFLLPYGIPENFIYLVYPIVLCFIVSLITALIALNGFKKHPGIEGRKYAVGALYMLLIPMVVNLIILLALIGYIVTAYH